jgi:large subunit ribosomal protein L11
MIIPVVISIFQDRSFTFELKTPPASYLILKELKLKSGSGVPNRDKIGVLSEDAVRRIAEVKMPDLNCGDIEAAMKTVAGTARSMGVDVAWNN